nr:MAG TPA: hypothetical protein [Caudoviricetes sp.]
MATVSEILSKLDARDLRKQIKAEAGLESPFSDVMDVLNTVGDAKNVVGERSLTEITKVANLEPRVLIEDTLRNHPAMPNILMTLTNFFSAHYLQGINLDRVVDGVSVLSTLDKFNPDRNVEMGSLIRTAEKLSHRLSKEAYMEYGYTLPNFKEEPKRGVNYYKPIDLSKISKEAVILTSPQPSTQIGTVVTPIPTDREIADETKRISQDVSSALRSINDMDSLAVGRMLGVTFGKYTIPVAVRMRPMSVPQLVMRELCSFGDIKESWTERWHRWRGGEISFIKDLIFQMDRIKHYRKLINLDKQGLLKENAKRRANNMLAAATSGNPSLGGASSFMIITTQTAKEVEGRIGAPISNIQVREAVFSQNSATMILIIDQEWERVITYTRGIAKGADYSIREFERLGKGNGPDITSIMQAFMNAQNPRF